MLVSDARLFSLPCMQGRAGVGLYELAAWLICIARLLHPTPPQCSELKDIRHQNSNNRHSSESWT